MKSMDKVHDGIRRLDKRTSTIIVNEDLVDTLQGIEGYSHLLVLYCGRIRCPDKAAP